MTFAVLLESRSFHALTLAQAEHAGETEMIRRLALVLGLVRDVSQTRRSVLAAGACYVYSGPQANPFSGEGHRCVKGNFSFWAYWLKDPLMVLACTLHVVRPTSDEMLAWPEPAGVNQDAALAAMAA